MGRKRTRWASDWAIFLLAVGYANGVPYSVMGRAFAVSRNSISSAIRRYVLRVPDTRESWQRNGRHDGRRTVSEARWDQRLIEPYAQRKLRRLNRPAP